MTATELQQKIDATSAEISTKTTRLTALTEEKRRVITSDEKKLLLLEKEESELPATIARLAERQRLLALEHDAALRHEAQARVREIEKEQTAIASRIADRRTAFLQGVDALLELIRGDYPDRHRAEELSAEAQYLNLAFTVPWPHVPAAVALSTKDLSPLEAAFNTRAQLRFAGGYWKELSDAIRAEHNRVAQQASDERRRATSSQMVRMYTPPFQPGKT